MRKRDFLLFIFFISSFGSLILIKDKIDKTEIEKCSFYTILIPIRMPDSYKVYFNFYFDSKKIETSEYLPFKTDTNLKFFRIMENRYLARISCNNFNNLKVFWTIKIPDTLLFIPKKGWKEIPYGLNEIKKE